MMDSSSAKTSRINVNSGETLTFTDNNNCIISLKHISLNSTMPHIEMYINDVRFMRSTSTLSLNVSTINIESGMFKTLVVTYDKINNLIITTSSVNLISICNATIFIPETGVRVIIPTNGVLIIPSGCIIQSNSSEVETSEEISIISQSQLITKWLKSLISSDLYKKAGDVEIRNKIISLVEQNSSQIEEIYNLIKKPNKLELAIFKNIRENILQMRVELVVTPLPELITNPDITNPDIPNISLDTVQKSDIPSNPDIPKEPELKKIKLDRL